MADYLHDEWCATKLDGVPDCDCVRKLLLDRDAQIAQLEQRVDELEERLEITGKLAVEYIKAYEELAFEDGQ